MPHRVFRHGLQTLNRHRYSTLSRTDSLIQRLLTPNDSDRAAAERELGWMKDELDRRQTSAGKTTLSRESMLDSMVQERVDGVPLQYVLGNQPFGPLLLNVCRPVLIPRPETEEWVARLSQLMLQHVVPAPPMNLLDLCTGTGCIPLFLCKELEGKTAVRAVGVDILPEAVGLSSENARLAGIPSSLGSPTSFTVWKDDIFHPAFPDRVGREIGKVDWLTSNPPYIPLHEIDGLDPSVREFESSLALVGDLSHLPPSFYPPELAHRTTKGKGLDFYLQIAYLLATGLMNPPLSAHVPQVVLEVGYDQARRVEEILKDGPARGVVDRVERWKDFAGIERVVVGFLKGGTSTV